MIIYRAATCPPWLTGAPDLCSRMGSDGAHHWALGDPILFAIPATGWRRIDSQTEAVVIGTATDSSLRRANTWFRTAAPAGCSDAWDVPILLAVDGGRAFVCPIGDDWLPEMTDEQARLFRMATEARAMLICASESEEGTIDAAIAARYAAEFIAAANHISIDTLRELRLIDEGLVIAVLCEVTCRG